MTKGPAPPRWHLPEPNIARPCIECKWVMIRSIPWRWFDEPRCLHPRALVNDSDVVHGTVKVISKSCQSVRSSDVCGPTGKLWEHPLRPKWEDRE